jgi:dihydrofolate reductase
MRRLRYNIAMSLDGFIARTDGSFDWIIQDSSTDFDALIAEFDTLLMERNTYEVLKAQESEDLFEKIEKNVVPNTLDRVIIRT